MSSSAVNQLQILKHNQLLELLCLASLGRASLGNLVSIKEGIPTFGADFCSFSPLEGLSVGFDNALGRFSFSNTQRV